MSTYEYTVHLARRRARQRQAAAPCPSRAEPLRRTSARIVIDGVSPGQRPQGGDGRAAATYSLLGAQGRGGRGAQRVVDVDPVGPAGEELRVTVGGGEPLFVQVHDLRDRPTSDEELAGSGAAGAAAGGDAGQGRQAPGQGGRGRQSRPEPPGHRGHEDGERAALARRGRIAEIGVREGQTVEAGQP